MNLSFSCILREKLASFCNFSFLFIESHTVFFSLLFLKIEQNFFLTLRLGCIAIHTHPGPGSINQKNVHVGFRAQLQEWDREGLLDSSSSILVTQRASSHWEPYCFTICVS